MVHYYRVKSDKTMKKLILTLMLICPALQAFNIKNIRANITEAQRREAEAQRQWQRFLAERKQLRLAHVQNYVENRYDRQQRPARSLWQPDLYLPAICVALVGSYFFLAQMNLENQK
jgi:hypothetical protein